MGLCSRGIDLFSGDVASRRASDEIVMRPSRGRGSTRSSYQTRAIKEVLSEVIDVSHGDTWLHEESLIFIGQANENDDSTAYLKTRGVSRSPRSSSNQIQRLITITRP